MIVRNASGAALERPEEITWPALDTSSSSCLDTSYRLIAGAVVDLSTNNEPEVLSTDQDFLTLISNGDLVRVVDGVDVDASVPVGEINGWADYNNAGSALSLSAGVWTTITNDGAGPYTNTNYLPPGVPELLDTTTGAMDFGGLALGDEVTLRQDVAITPQINGGEVELRIQLGQGAGTYYLPVASRTMAQGAGVEVDIVRVAVVYMGDTNTLGGAGVIQVRSSVPASLSNRGSAIFVSRREQ